MTNLRCAIYTRVSSDAGLEQEFNSLDAQRESAEAYVKSQAHEGWRLVRDRFDDGGFSGGSMERPALQQLLSRIRERRVDIVVVYKVDRLTRSLADFAKLVELFDLHKVSFVSVTQSFNTTSSMGRLTLNVLLSFAQFEREVTGERIRDKIAASKKKGIWMGGVVPHGYRVEQRKLIVVEQEADEVRLIFELYRTYGSVRAVQRELKARHIRTRQRVLSSGRTIGGIFFTNGPLAHILTNRHYLGEINHKGKFFPGEHAAIIDVDVFDEVQLKLQQQRRFRLADRTASGALLLGRIFNSDGERMTPSYSVKKGARYRYYLSVSAAQSRDRAKDGIHSVPAQSIETLVLRALQTNSPASEQVTGPDASVSAKSAPAHSSPGKGELSGQQDRRQVRDLIERRLERVIVSHDHVAVLQRYEAGSNALCDMIRIPWNKPVRTRQREILLPLDARGTERRMEGDERGRLLHAIARAHRWVAELTQGTVTDLSVIAVREGKTERSIRMTLSLAFLDPALIKAALQGHLPRGYGVTRLANLPSRFAEQWLVLGLPRPD